MMTDEEKQDKQRKVSRRSFVKMFGRVSEENLSEELVLEQISDRKFIIDVMTWKNNGLIIVTKQYMVGSYRNYHCTITELGRTLLDFGRL